MELKRISYKHKNNKPIYYLINYIRQIIPTVYYQKKLKKKLYNTEHHGDIQKRVDYYNKLSKTITLKDPIPLSDIKTIPGSKVYFFDLYQYSRYFNQKLKGLFLFGDIVEVPGQPTFVKSRPINEDNTSLEGNDVASNLKWVMSSQSIAVMPKPKYETWFMEGLLVADYHYILIKDDYSDLELKLSYYSKNPDKSIQIIKNANTYVEQFKNKKTEELISLLTIKKYFEKTDQSQLL